MQPNDIFRLKNDNIKELEVNRVALKQAKPKADATPSSMKPVIDTKTVQNINKINNNAVDMDEQVDKIETKTIKTKTVIVANATKPTNELKSNQKLNSAPNASDVANKSNNNVAIATAPKNPVKESTKKKSKEKDQKAAEEKRRQQEEEDERKRLELIAAQRKAKLVDQNATRTEQGPKRNNLAASVGE